MESFFHLYVEIYILLWILTFSFKQQQQQHTQNSRSKILVITTSYGHYFLKSFNIGSNHYFWKYGFLEIMASVVISKNVGKDKHILQILQKWTWKLLWDLLRLKKTFFINEMVNKMSKTDTCFGLYRGRITGHDVSAPRLMMLASDFTPENTTLSFRALATWK